MIRMGCGLIPKFKISGINPRWNNLVAGWKLEEASGTRSDVLDTYGLTDNNTVGSAAGLIGNAASFIAANSESLSRTGFSLNTDYTVLAWFNFSDTTNDQSIFSVGDTWPNSIQGNIRFTNVNRIQGLVGSGSGFVQASYILGAPDGNWHMVVMTFTDADQILRISVDNGTEVSSPALGSSHYAPGGGSLLEFGHQASLVFYTGLIDESYVFNGVKDAAWRTEMYNGGAGRQYPN